jgi:hypothetical protein
LIGLLTKKNQMRRDVKQEIMNNWLCNCML